MSGYVQAGLTRSSSPSDDERTMDIYQEIAKKRVAGETFVLATIVRTAGSSPRRVGAKMLIYPDGTISGTIGGGHFEKLVIEDSLYLLHGDTHHLLKTYRFEESDSPEATGMSCGGRADVFLEAHVRQESLIIFGGGHIGRAVAELAGHLGFRIAVVDDREEVLRGFRLPVETILAGPGYSASLPPAGKNCYVVIVTHGHKGDLAVLQKVIDQGCIYIGMIGSKAKIARVFSALQELGVDRALLDKVHAPIGLDIGAEGPHEIAISIVAEIIETRKKFRPNAS